MNKSWKKCGTAVILSCAFMALPVQIYAADPTVGQAQEGTYGILNFRARNGEAVYTPSDSTDETLESVIQALSEETATGKYAIRMIGGLSADVEIPNGGGTLHATGDASADVDVDFDGMKAHAFLDTKGSILGEEASFAMEIYLGQNTPGMYTGTFRTNMNGTGWDDWSSASYEESSLQDFMGSMEGLKPQALEGWTLLPQTYMDRDGNEVYVVKSMPGNLSEAMQMAQGIVQNQDAGLYGSLDIASSFSLDGEYDSYVMIDAVTKKLAGAYIVVPEMSLAADAVVFGGEGKTQVKVEGLYLSLDAKPLQGEINLPGEARILPDETL